MTPFEIFLLGIVLLVDVSLLIMILGILFGASFGAPFVPSGRKTVDKMIEAAEVKPGEKVFDLGCGDGRLVYAAAKRGADAVGIEISPAVFLLAKIRGYFSPIKNAKIRWGNFFSPKMQKELQEADILFAFLFPHLIERIAKDIFPHMKPGSRLVSHGFSSKHLIPERIIQRTSDHGKVFVFVKGSSEEKSRRV